jgi:hypothetical protein
MRFVNYLIPFAFSLVPTVASAAGDMLQPNELQTTGIEANPANDSGMFFGAGLSFGQARTTEEGHSPGLAYFLNLEPGYQVRRGSFNRLEFSAQLLFGKAQYTLGDGGGKTDVPVGFGLIAKAGYGWSLGDRAFGVAKIGAGPLMAKYEGHPKGAGKVESKGAVSGVATYLGWTMVAPIGDSLDATGGVSWTHMQYTMDKVKDSDGAEYDADNFIVNVPALELGLRLRI